MLFRSIEANRERWSEGVINTNKSEREMVCVEESVIYIRERERGKGGGGAEME